MKQNLKSENKDVKIKVFVDMIAPSVIKFNVGHFICGNPFRCVWVLKKYPTRANEQATLRHLGEKDGVTLRIYTRQVTATEEKKSSIMQLIKTGCIHRIQMTCSKRLPQKTTFKTL